MGESVEKRVIKVDVELVRVSDGGDYIRAIRGSNISYILGGMAHKRGHPPGEYTLEVKFIPKKEKERN
ncbi:MAG: hypothetical protein KKF68_01830 [Nanoarchaeota archaeon]|nr:hypothetical protein [Nanoarchaeota archaeon]